MFLPEYIKGLPIETQNSELEMLVENLFESSLAGYWDWHINDDYEYLSPTFKKMFGYEDHEMENHPSSWQKIIFSEDAATIMEAFTKHVESRGKIPFSGEVRYHHKNGSTIWVYCRGQVLDWNADGSPKRAVGVHIDITAIKELKEREIYIKRIEEANRDLEQLVYICSHDLREPLQTISGMINIIKDKLPADAEIFEYFKFIESGISRLDKLLQGLMLHSKLGINSEQSEVDLNVILSGVLSDLSSQIALTNTMVDYTDLPTIMGNPIDIRTLFQNLISNSIKFSKDKVDPKIKIEYQEVENNCVFYFSDNGIGIPMQNEQKVFQMFKRLHSEDQFPGYGIGLALVKKIVHLQNGSISLDSPRIGGTTFKIIIPKVVE